jgi:hypothetical protein
VTGRHYTPCSHCLSNFGACAPIEPSRRAWEAHERL